MGTKTVDQLTVITSLNSTDKIGVWKDSSDEYCGISFSDFGTNLSLTAYLKKDGSIAMTGTLDLGTHAISNITTLNGISLSTGFILAAGTVALTGDWDIGSGRKIKADQIKARSASGLALYDFTTGKGVFVQDTTGYVGIATASPTAELTVDGTLRTRQVGSTRYSLEFSAAGAAGIFYGYDSVGATFIPLGITSSILTLTVSGLATTLNSTGMGIGIATPDTQLHAWKASAGSVSAASDAIITAENNGDCAIQMLAPNANKTTVWFGKAGANNAFGIQSDPTNNKVQFLFTGTSKMELNSSSQLGIGIAPTAPLHVYHASASTITIDTVFATGVPRISFTGADIWRPANTNDLTLGSFGSASAVTIKTTGFTAIGTTTVPDSMLHVHNNSAGTVTATTGTQLTVESSADTAISILSTATNAGFIWFASPTSAVRGAVRYDHTADYMAFYTAAGARVIIDGSGHTYPNIDNTQTLGKSGFRWSQLWAGTTTINTSDEREKIMIKPSVLGLNFIRALNPISWVWPNDERPAKYEGDKLVAEAVSIRHERPHYGFTSQQVKQAMDKLGIDFGGYVYDPDTDVYGLRYDEFIAPIVRAVQEQQDIIDQLTESVRQLVSQVKVLQGA